MLGLVLAAIDRADSQYRTGLLDLRWRFVELTQGEVRRSADDTNDASLEEDDRGDKCDTGSDLKED